MASPFVACHWTAKRWVLNACSVQKYGNLGFSDTPGNAQPFRIPEEKKKKVAVKRQKLVAEQVAATAVAATPNMIQLRLSEQQWKEMMQQYSDEEAAICAVISLLV
jgi:hypothetical protein